MKRQSSGSFSRVLYAVTGIIHLLTHFWGRFFSVQLALARMSWSSPKRLYSRSSSVIVAVGAVVS